MRQIAKKVLDIVENNVVLITGVSIIVATHWGWSRLQNTNLVPEEKRKEMPIVLGLKYMMDKTMQQLGAAKPENASAVTEKK